MERRDRAIVTALLVLLTVLGSFAILPEAPAVAGPGPSVATAAPTPTLVAAATPDASGEDPSPSATPIPSPTPTPEPSTEPGIRIGVMSRPSSINPLTARTQADRDLVALIFSGLVRLGPDDTIRGDLAERWKIERSGARYTFTIRADARWHDGVPVTAEDVAFTVRLIQDARYNGPRAGSLSDVTVTEVSERVIRFDLATPLGGFLLANRLPILPAHLLRDVPIDELADAPFSTAPVGTGPYRLIAWDAVGARLEAVAWAPFAPGPSVEPVPSVATPSPLATASPSGEPGAVGPPPPLEFRFFGDPITLTETYRGGDLDVVSGLPASAALALARTDGSRLLRYPRATLTAVALNLRPAHPPVRDDNVRRALLKIVDREALIDDVVATLAVRADSLIPPSSWAFSAAASKPIKHDRNGAAAELQDAGWTKVDGKWFPKGAKEPFTLELITPDGESNPVLLQSAETIARQWTSFGIPTTVVPMAPNIFVTDRILTAKFEAAAVDVVVGLDPDLYPLLGSRQAGSGGSNISGFQNLELDKRLLAARRPGTEDARRAAYASLQEYLATAQVMLPLYWRDEPVVVSDRVSGPAVHLLADASDRFWDVLDWRLAPSR